MPRRAGRPKAANRGPAAALGVEPLQLRPLPLQACGQPFLKQFHEILDWGDGDDDVWTRWTPITPAEAAELEVACPEADLPRPRVKWDWLAEFARRRGRLVRDPKGRLSWSEARIDNCDLAPPG